MENKVVNEKIKNEKYFEKINNMIHEMCNDNIMIKNKIQDDIIQSYYHENK